ncbi:ABC transporter permease [Cellulomonas bogoriensis]|uniref:ABC transporter permease n=1 Tax=Cellulomonas bogoriensis 69B4 = DSM 16987 TaxID=1386082 RepID=A0A0A0BZU1_9CELL|nr:ABC transporter permease subunit [Cellulomonas bogoriensis]KGM13918.1 ABC transporter permease [Cellulomonas bogoriensis 69B4 = DSM 16987]
MTGSVLEDAFVWLNDPLSWTGPRGVLALAREHLAMAAAAVAIAAAVSLPLGAVLARARRGGGAVVVVANVTRAVPTFALLLIFATTAVGFGNRPTVIAAAVFAVPPILTNTWTALRSVDHGVREAAAGMGMSRWRSLVGVELPLAFPLIAAGLRTAAVQVVATIPLAALVGGGGLGVLVVTGLATRRFGEVLAGGLLVAALCLLTEAVLAALQRAVTPRGLRPVRVRGAAQAPGAPRS